jgi:FkbM family methyltransferase
MDRERLMRRLWGLPPFRRLEVRRKIWNSRNRLGALRRTAFERLGSDRYSHPALHDLDRKLTRWLPEPGGFFVEAGAYDGFIQSNTYWLERFRGWRGVLVEPVPHLFERARTVRSSSRVVNCGLVAPDHREPTVTIRYGGLMSLVRGARGNAHDEERHVRAGDMFGFDDVAYDISVPARTLSSVLEEAGAPSEIDLLSLDVEGFEATVLRGLDLDRFAPRFMLIEADARDRRARVEDVIGDRYELVERLSPMDLLYRRREPAPHGGCPPRERRRGARALES